MSKAPQNRSGQLKPNFAWVNRQSYKYTCMFVLRRISGRGVQMNQVLGEGYTFVSQEESYDEFCRNFERHFEKPYLPDPNQKTDEEGVVYAFVGNEKIVQPLFKNQKAYIMTGDGQTFANVSYR